MNLPSEAESEARSGLQRYFPVGTPGADAATALLVPQSIVTPFEFRSFTGHDVEAMGDFSKARNGGLVRERNARQWPANEVCADGGGDRSLLGWHDDSGRNTALLESVDAARQEAMEEGKRDGRRTALAEMEAEIEVTITRERGQLVDAVQQFCGVRERYFAEVEQEVVKLALAVAARVLHREATLDPLLLRGAVRVAMEKMADRSGVVLRVAAADVEAWQRMFQATQPSERPVVMADVRLERGECVLDTTMGTVELGVSVQLEEIEKGFFDLLNHRPVQ